MTIVIARAKPIKEIVVRSLHPKKFIKLENFIRKGLLKNLSIRGLIGNPLIVKINLPNPTEA